MIEEKEKMEQQQLDETYLILENFKIASSANLSEHWKNKHKRNKKYELLLLSIKKEIQKCTIPCVITFIRISPRQLDYDNLCYAFKKITDIICSYLIPDLAPGRADGDPRIKIIYQQRKGKPKEHSLHIRITSL